MIRSEEGGWAGLVGLQIDLRQTTGLTGSFFELYGDAGHRGRQVGLQPVCRGSSASAERLDRGGHSGGGPRITAAIAGQQTADWADYPGRLVGRLPCKFGAKRR